VGQCADWDAESPGQAKICDFDAFFVVDQDILRLQVSVNDPSGVAKVQRSNDLMQEHLF